MAHSISIDDLKIQFDGKVIYDPLPQQRKFHLSTAKYRLLGGSAGGGKSYAIMAEAIMRSLKYDFPLTGAIFRRSYPELESTIIRGMLEMLPRWMYKYNQQQHIMTLKNGSIIEFCYAESDNDVTRYQSREWDWIGVDELTHLTMFQWSYLMSRLRTTKPVNTKFFAGTNPGGRGHQFCKERWVTKSCDEDHYNPDDYDFIPAGVLDNPYIMEANPDYIENLKMLPEKERKALLEGDWDIFEGAFFSEFSPTRHIVDDFDVPEDWQLILSWDDGTREPRSVHLYAVDADQRVWCIWEYYREKENLKEAAENIRRKLQDAGYWGRIYKCVVDPSMKRKNDQTGISSIEVMEGMGFGFQVGSVELGNNNRVEGWRLMKSYLSHKPYEEPLLKFFRSCGNMIRTLPGLTYYQPKSGNTSKKEDLDCFVAGTKVDTLLGKKNIEDIKFGDFVWTPVGYRRVIKDGISGVSHGTSWIVCSDGKRLEGTPDHKVFIQNKGLVELQNLSVGDILGQKNTYLWKQRKCNTREYRTEDTPLVGTIVRMGITLGGVILHFTDRFILTILEKFLRGWQSITKTEIGTIIRQKTLSYWITRFIVNYTLKKERIYRRSLSNGEILQMEREYYPRTQRKCEREQEKYPVRVSIVASLLERRDTSRSIAQRSVSILKDLRSRNPRSVKFVEKLLNLLIRVLEPVHIVAVGNCEEEKIVYNLTVEGVHLYYANGKLVTNTKQEDHAADDARYALMSLGRLPTRFENNSFIKPKKRNYAPKSVYN